MTPHHIVHRRLAARRRRRIVGAIRLSVFLAAVVVGGLSLAAIGSAGSSAAHDATPAAKIAPAVHARHAAVHPTPAATASSAPPRSAPVKVASAARVRHAAATQSPVKPAAVKRIAARTTTVKQAPAPRALPFTGADTSYLSLVGAAVVLLGMCLQIAGTPLARQRS